MFATPSTPRTRTRRYGFTLVELLVVIGIIALLISILLPSLNRARQAAQNVQCASNMRQIATTLVHYSIDNEGKYPTNYGKNSLGYTMAWYDVEQIGPYLPQEIVTGTGTIGGSVFICPSDVDNAKRSYAMNIWASSDLQKNASWIFTPSSTTGMPRGEQFQSNVSNSSNMILIAERWPQYGNMDIGWFTGSGIGYPGDTPGPRFIKLNPPTTAQYGNKVPTEIDFRRHSDGDKQNTPESGAYGKANFAFADGHVEMLQPDQLADRETLISTRRAMWSPLDDELVEWEAQNPASNGTR